MCLPQDSGGVLSFHVFIIFALTYAPFNSVSSSFDDKVLSDREKNRTKNNVKYNFMTLT